MLRLRTTSVPVGGLPCFYLRFSLIAFAAPDEVSQPNEDMFDMILAPKRKPSSRSRSARATQPIVVNEDDDDVPLKPRSKKLSQREPSPVHVQIQPLKPNRRRQQKSKPIEPLFLESDEDAEMRDGDADLHDSARVPGNVIDLSQDDDLDDDDVLAQPVRNALSRKHGVSFLCSLVVGGASFTVDSLI